MTFPLTNLLLPIPTDVYSNVVQQSRMSIVRGHSTGDGNTRKRITSSDAIVVDGKSYTTAVGADEAEQCKEAKRHKNRANR